MASYRKDRIVYSVLIAICLIAFWWIENILLSDRDSAPLIPKVVTEVPRRLRPGSTTGEIVEHPHYILSYREEFEQAEWVAYRLEKSHLTSEDRKRPFFIEDPQVSTGSADWRNYRGSGYDRGHLCPAGDRKFSEQAYNDTFYTSNISPQRKEFNAGIWNRLEQQVRYWAKSDGPLTIITAGVLEKGLPTIGEEEVGVPNYFYKIVAKGMDDRTQVIAFLIPHREDATNLKKFVVSVDSLEQVTGLDFFKDMPDALEDSLEKGIDMEGWKF